MLVVMRRVCVRLAGVFAVLVLLAVPTAQAATADTATISVSPAPYHVGDLITFTTSPTPCTVNCRLIWRFFTDGGPHLGQQLGADNLTEVKHAFTTPGIYTAQLDLSEACGGTSRLTCDSYASVSVLVDVPPPPDPVTPPTVVATGTDVEAAAPDTIVNYQVEATQAGTVLPTSCSPGSGQAFPLGATTVDCGVIATNGTVTPASFKVHVADTTGPVLTLPSAVAVDATSSAGATVLYDATASDLVDGPVALTCSTSSG